MIDDGVIGLLLVLVAIVAFTVGYGIWHEPIEDTLKKFPICIEKQFGKETIKKCYDVVEVKP